MANTFLDEMRDSISPYREYTDGGRSILMSGVVTTALGLLFLWLLTYFFASPQYDTSQTCFRTGTGRLFLLAVIGLFAAGVVAHWVRDRSES